MKKPLFILALAAGMAFGMNAQDRLYMMEQASALEDPAPTAKDPYLELNPETNVYEGTLTLTKATSFKFYTKADPNTAGYDKVLAPPRPPYSTQVSFTQYLPFEGTCGWNLPGEWLPSMEGHVTTLQVEMTVDPEAGTVKFVPQIPVDDAPDQLYIWGSTDGAVNFTADYGKMLPSVDNPLIYEMVLNVPECGPFDATSSQPAPGASEKNRGFYFMLSPAPNGGGNKFGVPGLTIGEGKYIDFAVMDEFTASLVTVQSASLVALTPGKMKITFDYSTRIFTAVSAEEPGEPGTSPEKLYIMIAPNADSTPEVSDNDPYLTLTANGTYEGECIIPRLTGFRFYSEDENGNITVYGPTQAKTYVNFTSYMPYNGACTSENAGAWYVSMPNGINELNVAMVVDPDNSKVNFTAEPPVSETGYFLWGSTDGGSRYKCAGEFSKPDADATAYEIIVDVPECTNFDDGGDDAFGGGDVENPDHGWFFHISTDGTSVSAGTIFNAPEGERLIDLTKENDYATVDLMKASQGGLAMVCLNPGKVKFSLEPQLMILTVTLLESSAVETINTANDGVKVYNLQGVKVLESNDASAVTGLPKGIYIVNGQKVIVK